TQVPIHSLPNSNGYKISQDYMNVDGHSGVDLSLSGISGGVVVAAGSGTVTLRRSASDLDSFGFGNVLLIRPVLPEGTFYSLYAHLQEGSLLVSETAQVVAGQPIAKVDCTGRCDGAHLHFAVQRLATLGCGYITPTTCKSGVTFDSYVDPLQFV